MTTVYLTSLADLVQQTERLVGVVEAQRRRFAALDLEVSALEREATLLTVTNATLDKLLELLTVESVGKVEQLVTRGLRTVFHDQRLAFRFEVTTKFRAPWLEPRLIHEGIEAPILDAFGGGPATLVAFILRIVVISRLRLAPVLLLDEPFSMVSSAYVDRVGVLLRDLSQTLGLTIVMVTHQDQFLTHADRAYRAQGDPHGPSGTVFLPLLDMGPDSQGRGSAPAVP